MVAIQQLLSFILNEIEYHCRNMRSKKTISLVEVNVSDKTLSQVAYQFYDTKYPHKIKGTNWVCIDPSSQANYIQVTHSLQSQHRFCRYFIVFKF